MDPKRRFPGPPGTKRDAKTVCTRSHAVGRRTMGAGAPRARRLHNRIIAANMIKREVTYSNVSQACIIYYALCTLCTRRVPAARTPTTHHTSAACARERRCREKHARRSHESVTQWLLRVSFANGDYGVVQLTAQPLRGARACASSSNHLALQVGRHIHCLHAAAARLPHAGRDVSVLRRAKRSTRVCVARPERSIADEQL